MNTYQEKTENSFSNLGMHEVLFPAFHEHNPVIKEEHFLSFFTYLFLERGEGREKERERNSDVREKHQSAASGTHPDWGPRPGIER